MIRGVYPGACYTGAFFTPEFLPIEVGRKNDRFVRLFFSPDGLRVPTVNHLVNNVEQFNHLLAR